MFIYLRSFWQSSTPAQTQVRHGDIVNWLAVTKYGPVEDGKYRQNRSLVDVVHHAMIPGMRAVKQRLAVSEVGCADEPECGHKLFDGNIIDSSMLDRSNAG